MPKTEMPKTPEKKEEPKQPSPETRVNDNKREESRLQEEWHRSDMRATEANKKAAKKALNEWNRWEEAWHDAHKKRNNLTETERRTDAGKEADRKIDELRKGKLDGKKRKYSPTDQQDAAEYVDIVGG